jgi:pyrroloquinoline-quinone synthase
MAANDGFVREIFAMVKERRSFGRHPFWLQIRDGKVSQDGLCNFAIQFFLQVREFPRALSALHSRCFNFDERVKLAESLYEEETGKISGSAPHPELFIRLGLGVGLSREDMIHGKALPSTAALIDWFELSTKDRSFAEGIGAINIAAEGQVPETHYGLSREQVAFFDVHEIADRDHSDVGDNILSHTPMSEVEHAKVWAAVERSLDMWWQFFDGIQRACE